MEGEDLATAHWEDARHSISLYSDCLNFKLGVLHRVEREIRKLTPVAQKAASVDIEIIEDQLEAYHERCDLWKSNKRMVCGV